jgi:molecular chaperone DnaK (HSP70)
MLVKRGTTVPTKKSHLFTTTTDNQTSVVVTVFKGSRDFVANNTRIGRVELGQLTPSPRGVPKVFR